MHDDDWEEEEIPFPPARREKRSGVTQILRTQNTQDTQDHSGQHKSTHVLREINISLSEHLDSLFEEQESWSGQNSESPLWGFVRGAKAHPDLCSLSAAEATEEVEGWLESEGLSWTDFTGIHDRYDGQEEFYACWETVAFNSEEEPLIQVYKRSLEERVSLPRELALNERYIMFLSMAYWLQHAMRDRPIYLPCHRISQILGCPPMAISRYRKRAMRDGLLIEVARFELKKRATEFRVTEKLVV